ncbi:MAG: hypothetical protein BWK80_49475 [Desulfobacteraceae bacterium IS3]|nr:MAG: hypothetical protein BWK80_49475 [Desulfobacteraceae bacterium IS3]HAO19447.1 hypothetical protein [Desulfobacteraceae bacterium]
MNPPECDESDYINFLMVSPKVFSCTEAGKVQPDMKNGPCHDSINRLPYRLCPNAKLYSRFEAETRIIRDAVRDYPEHPVYA